MQTIRLLLLQYVREAHRFVGFSTVSVSVTSWATDCERQQKRNHYMSAVQAFMSCSPSSFGGCIRRIIQFRERKHNRRPKKCLALAYGSGGCDSCRIVNGKKH